MATATEPQSKASAGGGKGAGAGKKGAATGAKKDAAAKKAERPNGLALFTALLAKARTAFDANSVVKHEKDAYFRVQQDGRTVAYAVRGKTLVNVFPQTLAKHMPKDLGFRKVALGSHHYGRGEVVVPVTSEKDFDSAIKAMKAGAAAPALERKKPARAKEGGARVTPRRSAPDGLPGRGLGSRPAGQDAHRREKGP